MPRHLRLATQALAALIAADQAAAQYAPSSGPPTFFVVPPVVNTIDENMVSLISGKLELAIPLIRMGPLSYEEFHTTAIKGDYWSDANLGRVVLCISNNPNVGFGGSGECSSGYSPYSAVQAIHGRERATFFLANGVYVPQSGNGETFQYDGASSCTWTKKDGTQVSYYCFANSTNPRLAESENITRLVQPSGRELRYHYKGVFAKGQRLPLLSIESSDGFLLRYNYNGTIGPGRYSSVSAINRAYQACDPDADSCATAGWPSATFSATTKLMEQSDGLSNSPSYNGREHHIITLTDQRRRQHVFETDSLHRIISYQPPGASHPLFNYTLCSTLADPNPSDVNWPLRDCFGQTNWRLDVRSDSTPSMVNNVSRVVRNGQTWTYSYSADDRDYPSWRHWVISVLSPLGVQTTADGNATPPSGYTPGPVNRVTLPDGSYYQYEASVRNVVTEYVGANGGHTTFNFDANYRSNLLSITQKPAFGNDANRVKSATYPRDCANLKTCNQPESMTDARGNVTSFAYDVSGGLARQTSPAVDNVQAQRRLFYATRNAWYLDRSGNAVRDGSPLWLLTRESICRKGAAAGDGCQDPRDEVVTVYDYGPDSAPNNLLVRGIGVIADGETRWTCFGYDRFGNKIWEQTPNGTSADCAAH